MVQTGITQNHLVFTSVCRCFCSFWSTDVGNSGIALQHLPVNMWAVLLFRRASLTSFVSFPTQIFALLLYLHHNQNNHHKGCGGNHLRPITCLPARGWSRISTFLHLPACWASAHLHLKIASHLHITPVSCFTGNHRRSKDGGFVRGSIFLAYAGETLLLCLQVFSVPLQQIKRNKPKKCLKLMSVLTNFCVTQTKHLYSQISTKGSKNYF